MLINLSNHPLRSWTKNQIETAEKQFGEVVDLPFPNINPNWGEAEIMHLADDYFESVISILDNSNGAADAVHVMGELTFTFNIVTKLLNKGVICVASTTERNTKEIGEKKISEFIFVKFREYKLAANSRMKH